MKQSQDIGIATLHFVALAMTIGHFFTWSTLNNDKNIFHLKLLLGLIFWEKFNSIPTTLVSPFYATH
jgi:hypothetical protein